MLTSGGKEFTGILYPILILATLFLNKKFLKLKKCKRLLTQNFHFQGTQLQIYQHMLIITMYKNSL